MPNAAGGRRTAAVVVRPEKVRLDIGEGWQGQVVERSKGSTMSYLIRLTDGT